MLLAWTTVATLADADRIAADVITRKLAVCVQIDGPILSHYEWQGQPAREQEYRLCFKLLPEQAESLKAHVLSAHPYDTPEWLTVQAHEVAEKYLSWARTNSSTRPL